MATANKRTAKTASRKGAAAPKSTKAAKTAKAAKTTKKAAAKQTAAKKAKSKAARAKPAAKSKAAPKAAKRTAKKAAPKAAKKTAPKAAKKTAPKAAKKTAPKAAKKTAPKAAKAAKKSARRDPDVARSEARLFAPPTEGERADALRVLLEDARLAEMASVGRYRVIAAEPLVVKPPHPLSEHRLIRTVVYDYAADRSVDASVDIDDGTVTHLSVSRAQPMLAREEEAAAIAIAMADERVKAELSLGDEPQVAMHYWSRDDKSLSYARRSAAVIFGARGERPSLVAVVDLIDNMVCEIVPAGQW